MVLVHLIPLVAVSIPFAAVVGKFIVQPLVAGRGGAVENERVALLEQRVAQLEHTLEVTDHTVARLKEEADFLRQLAAPGPSSAQEPPV